MSAIKKGDWVVMVRGHSCAFAVAGGIPFVADEIIDSWSDTRYCVRCNATGIPAGFTEVRGPHRTRIPLSWLKKIDPPATDETTETRKEVTA